MDKPKTYLSQVFEGVLSVIAVLIGVLLVVLGFVARAKRAYYDFGGWAGLGGGGLLIGVGVAILLVCFLVPLFSKEKRRARGL